MSGGINAVNLAKEFQRWDYLYKHGGSDPFWPDGANLNLVRNHILYYKKQIKEEGEPYPDIYHRETPPEVPNDYIARPDEIRASARKSLETYKQDDNYRYMLAKAPLLDPIIADKLCIPNILGYVRGLEIAIKEDDLVSMRRHEKPSGYQQSFASGAGHIREYMTAEKEGQISIFDLIT